MLSGTNTFAASSPRSSVRVPRYLRRHTICTATQRRPTSPLARPPSSNSSVSSDCSFHTAIDSSEHNSSAFTSTSPSLPKSLPDHDQWPLAYLTTITKPELAQHDIPHPRRRFTWGGRNKYTDNERDQLNRRQSSRKLKKKRPESSFLIEQESHQPFLPRITSIYTQGDQEEFDPLKHLPSHNELSHSVSVDTVDEPQIGIAISSHDNDIPQTEEHPFDIPIAAILIGQDDEWEDQPAYQHSPQSERDRDIWLDDTISERIRSRTPQEILQGLDVVHEEEEEDSTSEVQIDSILEIRLINDNEKPSSEHISQPPRRRKLSKRRPSRRKLSTDSPPPPPLPERKPKSKSTHNTKKPSIPTLRPRRTPQTVVSSVRSHVFRPLNSFALLLGIDVLSNKKSRRRHSRELRTPNTLLVGRHFSGKHIPRFPSRLDGKRTVDKKIAKYE